MKFTFPLILSLLILVSCSDSKFLDNSKYQENMAKLDKLYGPCDNPNRVLLPTEKKRCEAAARAAGADGKINNEGISLTSIFNRQNNAVVYSSGSVNKDLWDASLKILDTYTIKNIDFEGGFIQTDWIYDSNIPDERCLIKSHITSIELVSTGINVKIICENFINNNWYPSNKNLINEEKKIALKILEESSLLSQRQS